MAALEVMLLALVLIFLVLIIVRADRREKAESERVKNEVSKPRTE